MSEDFTASIKSQKGFYIGDICYTLADKHYDEIWGKLHGYKDGVFEVPGTNAAFAVGSTADGDGEYYDQLGNSYGVDAGVIGCVPYELIDVERVLERYGGVANFFGESQHSKEPINTLNYLGLFVEGDSADFYSTGDGEFVINIRLNNKTVKSVHINTKYE